MYESSKCDLFQDCFVTLGGSLKFYSNFGIISFSIKAFGILIETALNLYIAWSRVRIMPL